jgi:hypothetical protein
MNPPKEEAKRLYHIFLTCQPDKYLAKQATLFCVGEMMKLNKRVWRGSKANGGFSNSIDLEYCHKVKKEIKKL